MADSYRLTADGLDERAKMKETADQLQVWRRNEEEMRDTSPFSGRKRVKRK
jgi:hypothetical protein